MGDGNGLCAECSRCSPRSVSHCTACETDTGSLSSPTANADKYKTVERRADSSTKGILNTTSRLQYAFSRVDANSRACPTSAPCKHGHHLVYRFATWAPPSSFRFLKKSLWAGRAGCGRLREFQLPTATATNLRRCEITAISCYCHTELEWNTLMRTLAVTTSEA
jgi:hypothetical protein